MQDVSGSVTIFESFSLLRLTVVALDAKVKRYGHLFVDFYALWLQPSDQLIS